MESEIKALRSRLVRETQLKHEAEQSSDHYRRLVGQLRAKYEPSTLATAPIEKLFSHGGCL